MAETDPSAIGNSTLTTSGLAKLETSIIKLQASIDVLRKSKKEFDARGEWKAATVCESAIGWLLESTETLRSAQKDLHAVLGR